MVTFPKFDRYVTEGEFVEVEHEGLVLRATVYRDDVGDTPEERDDGFWPSLDPKSAGYIGPKSRSTLARHKARAAAVLEAWKKDEWWYAGVAVTVFKAGVQLNHRYENALWGIECNYPGSDNSYLSEVASELVGEAIDAARATLSRLCAA